MLESLPEKFREHNLAVDARALLLLQKAMSRDLVKTLGDVYSVLKGIIVKDPSHLGPFVRAYYDYFLNITPHHGEKLSDAILRSETFIKWKEDNLHRFGDDIDVEELVDRFLDDVHLTSYDIQKILDGRELWDKDSGAVEDNDDNGNDLSTPRKHLDRMADYSDLTLEELMERMKEVMNKQKSNHSGGSHWLGTGGISPYGHGGAAKDGIRVGGTGGGKMARRVINDRNFYPVDLDETLNDNNVDAALASLKGVIEENSVEKLDVEQTIKLGLKRGGLFIPEIKNETDNNLQILLFIDNGGYSMSPFVRSVQILFRKMKVRFAHDMETYYFHNTIYGEVFDDAQRIKPIGIKKILKKDPNYSVFIIGDASMAPWELDKRSIESFKDLKEHFKKIAWLNPENIKYWRHTFSIQVIKELIDMYPLSPRGIEQAIQGMNRISK